MFCGKLKTPPPIIEPTTRAVSGKRPSLPVPPFSEVDCPELCVVLMKIFPKMDALDNCYSADR
jgi:hypothetical protein